MHLPPPMTLYLRELAVLPQYLGVVFGLFAVLAYGYAWMVNTNKEALAQQVMTDVHAPAKFRINGPLSNIPEFYSTFNIKEGDAMYRPDSLRIVIW